MRFMNIPHYASPINVDLIRSVHWWPADWADDWLLQRPWKVRRVGWWWKRRLWRDHGGSWYRAAMVRVYIGDDDYREITCKPGEAERFADDIKAFLRNLTPAGPERIVAAAIQTVEMNRGTLEILGMTHSLPAPARHHHILHAMPTHDSADVLGPHQQGFLTSTGRFVKRKEAMGIAVAAGQVPASKVSAPDLFSEDLW